MDTAQGNHFIPALLQWTQLKATTLFIYLVFDFGPLAQCSFHINVLNKQGVNMYGNISFKEKGSQSQQHLYLSKTISDRQTKAHNFTNSRGV